jgi:hypothetical protein
MFAERDELKINNQIMPKNDCQEITIPRIGKTAFSESRVKRLAPAIRIIAPKIANIIVNVCFIK